MTDCLVSSFDLNSVEGMSGLLPRKEQGHVMLCFNEGRLMLSVDCVSH